MHASIQQRIEQQRNVTRRQLLQSTSLGLGAAMLSQLLARDSNAAESEAGKRKGGLPTLPHFAPKAKRVIYLMQSGAPSHVDLFDHKPQLAKLRGQEIPQSVHQGQKLSTMTQGKKKPCLGAIAPMKQHGESGAWVSDYLPHTASIADDLCFIKSMRADAVNHAPAMTFLLTGAELPGRPALGSWLSYGLGSANENLPAYCVFTSRDSEGSCGQLFYDFYWGNGFLPGKHQGVKFRGGGDPVLYLSDPAGITRQTRRDILDGLATMNRLKHDDSGDPEILTRISQYEMAYRMQASTPSLVDLSTEPAHVLDMYGPQVKKRGSFAFNCLMARRLAQRGVQCIQLMHSGWDQHSNLPTQLKAQCTDTDQPSAALVKDLKQHGLLDDTLVIWGGEFGRTPFGQGDINNKKKHGRDHHPYAYTTWMAGSGVKAGFTHGATDEFGYNVVEDEVHVHDFQATIMHLLGIDHTRLTFRHQGRDFRLTDVHGHVVRDIIA